MRHASSTWTEQHRLLAFTLCVLALLTYGLIVGQLVGTIGVRAVTMALGLV